MHAYIPCSCAQTMWSCLCSSGTTPMTTNNAENNLTATTSTINVQRPPTSPWSIAWLQCCPPTTSTLLAPCELLLAGWQWCLFLAMTTSSQMPNQRMVEADTRQQWWWQHTSSSSSWVFLCAIQVSLHKYSPPFPCLTLDPGATSLSAMW